MRYLLAAFTCTAAVVAQTTHVVGLGGHPQIQAALAVASPGDVVIVQPGNYLSFQCTIGVTICAAVNGTTFVIGTSTANLPVGQALHFVDLDLGPLSLSGGTVTLDRCRVTPGVNALVPPLWIGAARAHLQDCVIGGQGAPYVGFGLFAGLVATNATVTATSTSFRGLDRGGLFGTTPGSAGVHLTNSTFQGSNLVLEGGDGLSTGPLPGPALVGGPAWISDSTLRGGRATNLPGMPPTECPAVNATGTLARCTLVPAGCATAMTNGPGLTVRRTAPMVSGGTLQLDCRGEPNESVAVFVSLALGAATFPELAQPVSLDLATIAPLTLLTTDGTGQASASWPLPAGFRNFAVWIQAFANGPQPLQVSPVSGGVLR